MKLYFFVMKGHGEHEGCTVTGTVQADSAEQATDKIVMLWGDMYHSVPQVMDIPENGLIWHICG